MVPSGRSTSVFAIAGDILPVETTMDRALTMLAERSNPVPMFRRRLTQRLLAALFAWSVTVVGSPAIAAGVAPEPSTLPQTWSEPLMWSILGLGGLHQLDHGLRGNHSGFPFNAELRPLTASFLIYPLYLGGRAFDAGPLYWTVVDSAVLGFVGVTHLTVEHPGEVYNPWTDGSNLLGWTSPALGTAAVVVTGLLVTVIAGHLAISVHEGRQHGFTWFRSPSARQTGDGSSTVVQPISGGLQVSRRWTW